MDESLKHLKDEILWVRIPVSLKETMEKYMEKMGETSPFDSNFKTKGRFLRFVLGKYLEKEGCLND
jgi:hypothetical protein